MLYRTISCFHGEKEITMELSMEDDPGGKTLDQEAQTFIA
jgi:hypothetical protein